MSLHINVDYILNNIVFVKLESRYVFIEKHAWNTLVSTFFRPDQRTAKKLQEFKNYIFDLYYEIKILKKQVNLENINQQLLIMIEPDLDQEIESMKKESTMSVDAQFIYNDESNLYMESYIGSSVVAEKFQEDEKKFYVNLETIFDKSHESIKESINMLRVTYDYSDTLVKTIGFMRCVNLMMSFVLENQVYVRSEHEKKFIDIMISDKNSIFFYLCKLKNSFQNQCNGCICKKCRNENFEPFLNTFYKCGKCSSENTCNYHLDYNFYCKECSCINCHGGDEGKMVSSNMSNRNLMIRNKHQDVLLFDQHQLSQNVIKKLTEYDMNIEYQKSLKEVEIKQISKEKDDQLKLSGFDVNLFQPKVDVWGKEIVREELVVQEEQENKEQVQYGGFNFQNKKKGSLW